ncbi:hypothetical protein H4R33_000928 [Dimargaris cristalligena]|nr:hypothetical protein H4R33_000928 [Dimargaris cristalligena]
MLGRYVFRPLALLLATANLGAMAGQVVTPPDEILSPGQVEVIPNSYIVQFSESTTTTTTGQFYANLKDLDCSYTNQTNYIPLFNGAVLSMNEATAYAVADLPMVESVWPNLLLYPMVYQPKDTTDPLDLPVGTAPPSLSRRDGESTLPDANYTKPALPILTHQQTGVDKLQSQLKLRGKGVKIGVLDTGLDLKHPAFGKCYKTKGCRVAYGMDIVGPNFTYQTNVLTPVDDPHDDCLGHGTHVAGVLGGNDGVFQGVAPDATLGIYKITSCLAKGATSSQAIIMALQQAYKDGMDVINLSYGIVGLWQESAEAVMASRLVRQNVVVVAAAGNSGTDNLWTASSPASGANVISAASVTPEQYQSQFFAVSNNATRLIPRSLSQSDVRPFQFTSATLELAVDPTGDLNSGCYPYSKSYAGSVVVVTRGVCPLANKGFYALQAGAVGMIVINQVADLDGGLAFGTLINIPSVLVTSVDGQYLVDILKKASASAPLTITANLDFKPFPYATPHRISVFSSWGPGNELELKPDMAAVGSQVYSSYPTTMGTYTMMSGTSSSSPYLAGVAALLIEKLSHCQKATEIRRRLMNMGSAAGGSVSYNMPVGSVAQQGAGDVMVYNAFVASVSIDVAALALNDTVQGNFKRGSRTVPVTFTNNGNKKIRLMLGHLPAAAASAYNSSGIFQATPSYDSGAATLSFSKNTLELSPQKSAVVRVTVTQPSTLHDSQFWVYSGYVTAMSNEVGLNGQLIKYSVPYLGFKGDLGTIPILSAPALGLPSMLNITTGQLMPFTTAGYTYSLTGTDYPRFRYRMEHPTRRIQIKIYKAESPNRIFATVYYGSMWYLSRNIDQGGTPYVNFTWDGRYYLQSAQTLYKDIPNGSYYLKLHFLKPFGNPSINSNNWEIWTTPKITINRPVVAS